MKYLKKFENWNEEEEILDTTDKWEYEDEYGHEYDKELESEFTHPLIDDLENQGYKIREKSGNEDGSIATINSEYFEDWIKDNIEESDHNYYMRKNVPQKKK